MIKARVLIAAVAALIAAREIRAQSPSDLIGEWGKSRMSSVDFVNPSTGAHADPSGERTDIRFFPDGTYKLGWLLQSSLYNCSSRVFGYKTGVYAVDGSTLTVDVRTSTLTSRDTCHPEWNYEKKTPTTKATYQWRMQQTRSGLALLIRDASGKEEVYLKQSGTPLLQ